MTTTLHELPWNATDSYRELNWNDVMGVEYTLANHKNKTLFELGKGPWYWIMDPPREDLPNFLYKDSFIAYFVKRTNKHYTTNAKFDEDDHEENLKYFNQLANMVWEFIEGADPEKELSIANDCDDSNYDLRNAGYMYLGSRYTGMTDYSDSIVRMNRHIKSVDFSAIDFSWPISRIRKLIPFM